MEYMKKFVLGIVGVLLISMGAFSYGLATAGKSVNAPLVVIMYLLGVTIIGTVIQDWE